ncbi:hypothetical protein KPH14_012602 [Odynerus spinipes]|uniref:Uncharacterized protein n=1 Tax=Odynerus spinipes TaxID=1348599 RepID=A0AAD9RFB8_9HYME|nr:hypothetical protein KPH14_012602 [Odynerus spinipes]
MYEVPSVASRLGTLIKQIGKLLITECIRRNDVERQQTTKNYLKLLVEEFGVTVNKTVEETVSHNKRQNKVNLPSNEDIRKLCNYLTDKRNTLFSALRESFSYTLWYNLLEVALISLQVFNRRRAGEIERVLIDDFKNRESISEKTYADLYKSLSTNSQEIAKKYERFVIQGKLGRSVSVLLDTKLLQCIELLLHYRQSANVHSKNPYLFGIPGLRGTKLRKHIATRCVALQLNENEITDLANFIGHDKAINKNVYRQSIPEMEILKMSKLLLIAQGDEQNVEDEISIERAVGDCEENSENNINVSRLRRLRGRAVGIFKVTPGRAVFR